ncbi:PREDICTED: GATA zinc finger domain-containing protein 1-like [Papilio polytes]|uniref:GATA zinc finger domain-containing protein 1-like n=1 Tax=Papilio polytes TaxID=76194 RepID=UPI000675D799|nr:PREDICTED: GATA zinc finger domain-containing protein 1-like [Papilio polytes]
MPKPVCVQCNTLESLLWRMAENGIVCNDCHLSNTVKKDSNLDPAVLKSESVEKTEDKDNEGKIGKGDDPISSKGTGKGTRKSTRASRYKPKTSVPYTKTSAPRGRGRKSIFKRQPIKAPTSTATVVDSDSIFYKGSYMQVGDIVSMVHITGGIYYAQIRGFLTDQYCEKSAVVTWLLPTRASPAPEEGFDPSTYIFGPEEDLPRKLDYMEFVMHAPSDYYMDGKSHYHQCDSKLDDCSGFPSTTLGPRETTTH